MPVAAIIEKAHQVGAQVSDQRLSTSADMIPVDVTTVERRIFTLVARLNRCRGGPGGVFLYVRPDGLTTLQPKITGWFAHQKPFTFDVENFVLREDVYRLANGTPGISSLYAIQPGAEIIAQVGVDNVRGNLLRRDGTADRPRRRGRIRGHWPRDPATRAGTVTVRPGDNAYAYSRELLARNIVIDYREGAGIRIAPHFSTATPKCIR